MCYTHSVRTLLDLDGLLRMFCRQRTLLDLDGLLPMFCMARTLLDLEGLLPICVVWQRNYFEMC